MRIRPAHWLALCLVASGLTLGCGGGGIEEGAPAENPGYVGPESEPAPAVETSETKNAAKGVN